MTGQELDHQKHKEVIDKMLNLLETKELKEIIGICNLKIADEILESETRVAICMEEV